MLPLIYTNPAAAGLFLVQPAWSGWFQKWSVCTARWRKVSRKADLIQDRGSLVILLGLQWIGLALNFLLAWLLPAAAIPWQRTALFFLGLTVILLGVALRWYAIGVLGAYFTRDVAVSRDQPVVNTARIA